MKLDDSRRSDNVEDERGSAGVGMRGAGIGLGTLVIVVIGYFMGVSPSTLLSLLNGDSQSTTTPAPATPVSGGSSDPQVDFVRAVLGETEDVWGAYFKGMGKAYTPPKLVLFSHGVNSACGFASSASGPFYCPGDQRVYIDLTFFNQLATQFGAPGEFARAYVISHEVGHHVQNLLGITDSASRQERSAGQVGGNHVSVMVELQADCLEQGLKAASSVGDDTLQRRDQGTVVPDSFTHGTAEQRVRWFRRGFDSGTIDNCDTFNAGSAL